ncbi:MAG: bifunctional phosphoribosyl-AMP cyclohydrolase/phosphoribosyl-ATP diphosphatase HisIE [Ignavibacteriales bacterium]|nr:bifunctional phosphoribosyl-AMP cyclohydrolase/phosphoribosyl-ATP diphosphatase HisIE [Ignavibacteriales bacterium]
MIDKLNFDKMNGLIPAIIQDPTTRQVLMLGYMNKESLTKTLEERRVTFWSRTKDRLWQKGEISGNVLEVVSIKADCDGDALLVYAHPAGPVCHTGVHTCFGEEESDETSSVLGRLENTIRDRRLHQPEGSYTAKLFQQGTGRIAQKVGEEAIETVVAALQHDRDALKEESADLLYHLIVLLEEQGVAIADVAGILKKRMEQTASKPSTAD